MTSKTVPVGTPVHSNPLISKKLVWTGRAVSGLAVLFFLFDGVLKLFKPAVVVEATRQLGYPESHIVGIGVLLLACTLLYVFPRTSVLGAILLTAYMGGAVASQVRIGAGWFNVMFAAVFGALVWAGLWLRDIRVRNMLGS
ncbi:MAG TPA: DoxX family protein [Candidatus Saccharimonadales bacterium]|nr:DoxX family protein [Candidatus Saccharimonadales bacterium]